MRWTFSGYILRTLGTKLVWNIHNPILPSHSLIEATVTKSNYTKLWVISSVLILLENFGKYIEVLGLDAFVDFSIWNQPKSGFTNILLFQWQMNTQTPILKEKFNTGPCK